MVDVVNEAVERRHALLQAFLHIAPLVRGNDARNDVKRNQTLSARTIFVFVAIDRKGNAHAPENNFGLFASALHELGVLTLQPCQVIFVMGANIGLPLEQISLVKLSEHLIELVHGELLALTIANKVPRIKTGGSNSFFV